MLDALLAAGPLDAENIAARLNEQGEHDKEQSGDTQHGGESIRRRLHTALGFFP
jgi:hypothetical protein